MKKSYETPTMEILQFVAEENLANGNPLSGTDHVTDEDQWTPWV